ncbi:MAG: hypothetical protein WCF33_04905 [Pseudonocardiaceae bacterium]
MGWHQFDERAAGVQQCVSHLFRHLQSVLDLHPDQQAWAGETRDVLRETHTAVAAAKAAETEALDPALLGDLRARYDKTITWGQATNRHRDWDGKVSGYWHTLSRLCTVRSYLTSACNHGHRAIDHALTPLDATHHHLITRSTHVNPLIWTRVMCVSGCTAATDSPVPARCWPGWPGSRVQAHSSVRPGESSSVHSNPHR